MFMALEWYGIVLSTNSASKNRDLMVGYADGYGIDVVWRLSSAFQSVTQDNADLVLFTTSLSHSDKKRLYSSFPRLHLRTPIVHAGGNPAFMQYVAIQSWILSQTVPYQRVILTDTRDIALFDDPFKQVQRGSNTIQTFTEVVTYKYDHWYNQVWIRNCYGQAFLNSIMEQLVVCCGVVASSLNGVKEYLNAFISEYKSKKNCDPTGTDTAIHAWLTFQKLNMTIVNSDTSLIRHSPKWGGDAITQLMRDKDVKYDDRGRLLNHRGVSYALIHQVDRFPSLWGPYCKRHKVVKQ